MRSTAIFPALLASLALVSAQSQDTNVSCDNGNKCPESAPCCSQYGVCGVGAYCLGGCDPMSSFDLTSCVAAPVCKSGDYKMTGTDDIMPNTQYLGDPSKANWVSSGSPLAYGGDSVLLTMAQSTVGTLLMSTHYVWYGKISAKMTTSAGQGVVTAFIMMSDVKDEIDFEFVGDELEAAQSNYYWQGVKNYDNMKPLNTSNTQQNEHTYTIDWQADQLTWSIDGQPMRTLKKSDTYNETTKQYNYPQTPSRVQLSLWPAGLSSNGQGTVEWAGGLINWNSNAMQNGYYFARVTEIDVECYDAPSSATGSGSVYYYTSLDGLESDVAFGNNDTTLGSFLATGDDPKKGLQTTSSAGSTATEMPNTVPGGLAGAGIRGDDGSGSSSSSSGSTSGGSTSGGSSGNVAWTQGDTSGNSSGANKVVAGSAVALVGFFVAALML